MELLVAITGRCQEEAEGSLRRAQSSRVRKRDDRRQEVKCFISSYFDSAVFDPEPFGRDLRVERLKASGSSSQAVIFDLTPETTDIVWFKELI
jgi:hypothetical protein